MKFLCLGNFWKCGSEQADEINICDVLEREGHTTIRYNRFEIPKIFGEEAKSPTGHTLTPEEEEAKRKSASEADVILTWKGGEFTPEVIKRLRELCPDKPIYFIQHDLMEANISSTATMEQRSPASLPTQHIQQARDCDAYFSKEIGWRKDYEKEGVNFIYWPEDACPDFYEKVDTTTEDYQHKCQILELTREYPVVFTGTWSDMGINRAEYLKPIRDALDLTIFSLNPDAWQERGYKAQSGMWDDNYAYLVSKAKINLALDWRHDIEGYWSDRIAQILGAGGFVLAKYTLGMERAFGPDKENLVYWTDQLDFIEKAKYYLEHEDERLRIAKRGHEYCEKYLKFDYRVRQFLTILRYQFGIGGVNNGIK